jgi:biotin carboxyl carrier protein
MRYYVAVNGTDLELELEGESVRIGTESRRAHLADIDGGPLRMLTLDDAVHRVQLRITGEGRGRYTLWIDGFRFDVEALDERARAIRDLSASTTKSTGPAPLVAPMPGMIVRVNIADGDTVQPGQGLVVMEAMKMENELRATAAGTVKRVLVAPGMAVEKGTLLLEME